jgi:hypothetical protein
VSDSPALEMPRYTCHKTVHALQIKQVDDDGTLHFELSEFAPKPVGPDWLVRHKPQPGGYFVVYADGYMSFSPKEAFESGYSLDRTSTNATKLLCTITEEPDASQPAR